MSATIRAIVDDSLELIGEVAGVGVQEYSEDQVFKDVVRGFNLLFKKYPWHQYRKWFTIALDGTLGIPSTDAFETVIDFEDFILVHNEGESRPLPILPMSTNPNVLAGTKARYWTGMHVSNANYAKRKLQFYPVASIGNLNVLAKVYPLTPPATGFDWEDVLYLDKDLLTYAGAYMTLVGDDLNPGAAETVRGYMDARYKDIMAALSDHPIPIHGRTNIPNEWFVR